MKHKIYGTSKMMTSLRTLNRCHSLPHIRNRSLNKHKHLHMRAHVRANAFTQMHSLWEYSGTFRRWVSFPFLVFTMHIQLCGMCLMLVNVEHVYCWLKQLRIWYHTDLLDWNDRHTEIIRWPCPHQLNIPSGEVDRVLLNSTKQSASHYEGLCVCVCMCVWRSLV